MTLETERLIIRSLLQSDAEAYHAMHNSCFVQRYNAMRERSLEEITARLGQYEQSGEGPLALALKDSGACIGQISVDEDSLRYGVNSIEISYWLGEQYARQGYMSEALKALIRELFTAGGYASITARCFGENEASLALLRKLGFEQEGRLRGAVKACGGIVYDDVLFSLRKEDYM